MVVPSFIALRHPQDGTELWLNLFSITSIQHGFYPANGQAYFLIAMNDRQSFTFFQGTPEYNTVLNLIGQAQQKPLS